MGNRKRAMDAIAPGARDESRQLILVSTANSVAPIVDLFAVIDISARSARSATDNSSGLSAYQRATQQPNACANTRSLDQITIRGLAGSDVATAAITTIKGAALVRTPPVVTSALRHRAWCRRNEENTQHQNH
jgi:hypothetical protein